MSFRVGGTQTLIHARLTGFSSSTYPAFMQVWRLANWTTIKLYLSVSVVRQIQVESLSKFMTSIQWTKCVEIRFGRGILWRSIGSIQIGGVRVYTIASLGFSPKTLTPLSRSAKLTDNFPFFFSLLIQYRLPSSFRLGLIQIFFPLCPSWYYNHTSMTSQLLCRSHFRGHWCPNIYPQCRSLTVNSLRIGKNGCVFFFPSFSVPTLYIEWKDGFSVHCLGRQVYKVRFLLLPRFRTLTMPEIRGIFISRRPMLERLYSNICFYEFVFFLKSFIREFNGIQYKSNEIIDQGTEYY